MWPGLIYGDPRKKERKEFREKLNVLNEEIIDHFGGALASSWIDVTFINRIILKIGVDLLTVNYGFCEYCKSYMGVSSVKRRIYDIPVLSSYCKEMEIATKPRNRCIFYEPNRMYKKIIISKIEKAFEGNFRVLPWHRVIEEDY